VASRWQAAGGKQRAAAADSQREQHRQKWNKAALATRSGSSQQPSFPT